MDFIASFILGPAGAALMVIFGILTIILSTVVIPIVIATDKKCLFDKRLVNIIYALLTFILPILALFYLFFSKRVLKTFLASIVSLLITILVFFARSILSNYYI